MKIVNGTHYHEKTSQDVIDVLEKARAKRWRLRIHYGNPLIGRDWNEQYDVLGRVGRSMGPVKVPLLLYDRRSICGSPVLDHCIVRIRFANMELNHGDDLYRHHNYHGEAA
jgi:hypothetical protein